MTRPSPLLLSAFVVLIGGCGPTPDENVDAGSRRDASVEAGPLCASDNDCGGSFCAPLSCQPGADGADERGCVSDPNPCAASERCDDNTQRCEVPCAEPDADGDSHRSVACGGDDCDDLDPNRYPTNPEVCDPDGHDEDCRPETFGDTDADGDGFVSSACCNGSVCGPDCDDSFRAVAPGQPE